MSAGRGVGQEGDPSAAFMDWARSAAIPVDMTSVGVEWASLEALRQLVGDARIVAISEGVHGGAEPLVMRNRMLEYLVREMGFGAIAIESGIAEGRVEHDYVRGGPGDLDEIVAQGFSWTFDQFPQNRDLVQWLREENMTRSDSDKIDFYGFDVPGSPGNTQANRGMRTGLEEAVSYLASVDPEAGAMFEAQMPKAEHYQLDVVGGRGYALSDVDRDRVTALVTELISLLRRNEIRYAAASTPEAYAWGLRTAIGAIQADTWLRRIPRGWGMSEFQSGETAPLIEAHALRDRAQADNIRWVLEREGPSAKVVLFAANAHTSAAPLKSFQSSGAVGTVKAGNYLRRWYGPDYFVIGNTVRAGGFGCGNRIPLPELDPSSLPSALGQVGMNHLFLDLRTATGEAREWLEAEKAVGPFNKAYLMDAYDILFYVDEVTPAC